MDSIFSENRWFNRKNSIWKEEEANFARNQRGRTIGLDLFRTTFEWSWVELTHTNNMEKNAHISMDKLQKMDEWNEEERQERKKLNDWWIYFGRWRWQRPSLMFNWFGVWVCVVLSCVLSRSLWFSLNRRNGSMFYVCSRVVGVAFVSTLQSSNNKKHREETADNTKRKIAIKWNVWCGMVCVFPLSSFLIFDSSNILKIDREGRTQYNTRIFMLYIRSRNACVCVFEYISMYIFFAALEHFCHHSLVLFFFLLSFWLKPCSNRIEWFCCCVYINM